MKRGEGMFRMTYIALAVLLAPTLASSADDPPPEGWQITADLGLNFNQSSYSDSWKGGEQAAISWTLSANGVAEKQMSPKANWRNTLKLSFGQTHMQEEDPNNSGERHWASPEKSTDRIFFESLFRLTLGHFVDPYGSVTFESQFYDPSHPAVDRFINPILLTESAGVGRTLIKNEQTELYSRLGGAIRQHIDNEIGMDTVSVVPLDIDYPTEFASTLDGGLEWVTDFKHTFAGERMKYDSKLRLFQAFFYSESDDLEGLPEEDYWKTADIAWENTFSASVSKYIQVSLFFELLYDKEIDLRGRFRENLGLGVAYKLF